MQARRLTGLVLGAVLAASACGSPTSTQHATHSPASATQQPSGTPTPGIDAQVQGALQLRIEAAPKLPGETIPSAPDYETRTDYVDYQDGPGSARSLKDAGMQGAAVQHLIVDGGRALRVVLALGSHEAACAMSDLRTGAQFTLRERAVPGVPCARVHTITDPAGTTLAHNITFAVGRYAYLVGDVRRSDDLATAARRWYAAVKATGADLPGQAT